MDSGASHNVMSKVVMDELELDITKPYQDLYSFDSKKSKCLGVIKDLVVTLSQLPIQSIVMEIIVDDIPPKFGMLLSRSWAKKVGGSLQMDLTYATIPIFWGQHRKLYREFVLSYIVIDLDNTGNHPIYAVDNEIGSTIFHISDDFLEPSNNNLIGKKAKEMENSVWKMCFDGSCSKGGSCVGVVIISPSKEVISMFYKLEFETTNNIAEYEVLLLGLGAAKDMGIDKLAVFGDFELVIHQVNNIHQTKKQRLKQCMNDLRDFVENFFLDFNITFVQRKFNQQEDSLALETSNFKAPLCSNLRYEIEVKHRPSIPNNIKHWQVFSDDQELKKFLETIDEFSAIS
jgi:ribonuclease HI